MRDVLALLTAGLGMIFLGLHLVSSGLQESASRTLRTLVRRSTSHLLNRAMVGIAAGAIMQSTSAVTTVIGSMATSGMITLEQAIPIVAFANVGTTALVFAGAIDVSVAVLFAVGICGIVFSMTAGFRWRAISAVALGVALLLYGGDLMTDAAGSVERAGWFFQLLESVRGSAALAFILGTAASFLTQSTAAVALMTVALGDAHLVDLSEATAMIYGANLGSTLVRMLLTRGCTGTLRQVSRFQDLFKVGATLLFIVLFVVERRLHVPLVNALVAAITPQLALELALINLLFNGSMALITGGLSTSLVGVIRTRWPSSVAESLSVPEYLIHDAATDPATGLDLLEKEQMRVLRRTREYLSLARGVPAGPDRLDPASLHRSFLLLFKEIDHFQTTMISQHVDSVTSERLGNVQARQKLVELIEESTQQLSVAVLLAPPTGKLDALAANFIEALDFLLMFAGDAARTLDRGRAEFLFDLSSDRGEMMGSIRGLHLAPDQGLTADDRALLLRLTTLFERIVWMLQRYAELLLKNVGSADTTAAPVAS